MLLPFKSCSFKLAVINHLSALSTWRRCLEGSKFTYLFMTNDEYYSQKKGNRVWDEAAAPQARFPSTEHNCEDNKADINHSDSHSDAFDVAGVAL